MAAKRGSNPEAVAAREEPATEDARRPGREMRRKRERVRAPALAGYRAAACAPGRVRADCAGKDGRSCSLGRGQKKPPRGEAGQRMPPRPKGPPACVVRWSGRRRLAGWEMKREAPEKPFQGCRGASCGGGARRGSQNAAAPAAGAPAGSRHARAPGRTAAKCAGMPGSPAASAHFFRPCARATGNDYSRRLFLPGHKRPQKSPPGTARGDFFTEEAGSGAIPSPRRAPRNRSGAAPVRELSLTSASCR